MRNLVLEAGHEGRIEIASAGTASYHRGELPDPRSRETAQARGVALESRSRQFERADFARFDYVLAMDGENLEDLRTLGRSDQNCEKITLLRSFDPSNPEQQDVPDPYYGGEHGFDLVFDICEASCQGLLNHIAEQHELD